MKQEKGSFYSEDELRGLIVENQISDEDITEIINNQKFKNAVNNIFGTTDLNELHTINEGVISIKKYVDHVYKNTIINGDLE